MKKWKQSITAQNKGKKKLDRQTAKISTLSSGNVNKYEILIGQDVLLEKDLIEKAATIKRLEYLSLGSRLQKINTIN